MLNSARALERRLGAFLNAEQTSSADSQIIKIQKFVRVSLEDIPEYVKWTRSLIPLLWTTPPSISKHKAAITEIATRVVEEIKTRLPHTWQLGVRYTATGITPAGIEDLKVGYNTTLEKANERMRQETNQLITAQDWPDIATTFAIKPAFALLMLNLCNEARTIQSDGTVREAINDRNNPYPENEKKIIEEEYTAWKEEYTAIEEEYNA